MRDLLVLTDTEKSLMMPVDCELVRDNHREIIFLHNCKSMYKHNRRNAGKEQTVQR